MDRENQEPLEPWKRTADFNEAFSMKMCLSPSEWHGECDGQIVKSHTVSKSGSLNRIARNGHVYSRVRNLHVTEMNTIMNEPVLVGVNRASTFTGFCSKHDNNIFSPLEKKNFAGTPEQCFLIGYRAIARELYCKIGANQYSPLLKDFDKGRGIFEQIVFQHSIQGYELGIRSSINDLDHYKTLYDSILTNQRFETVRGYVIEFSKPLPVMCSGTIFPDQDLNGEKLQDLGDLSVIPDQLSFSSFFGGEFGVVVFSWLSDHEAACKAFIESLKSIPDGFIIQTVLSLFFAYCENIHIAPDWWEGQTAESKETLIKWMNIHLGPTDIRFRIEIDEDAKTYTQMTGINRYEIHN